MNRILIIGGGASGMAAAISAAQANPSAQITILDGLDRIGKKILATGNGRCNLTNAQIAPGHYHTQNTARLNELLADMPAERPLTFFRELGLYCTEEWWDKKPDADSHWDIFPIPRDMMGADHTLKQNPGYN